MASDLAVDRFAPVIAARGALALFRELISPCAPTLLLAGNIGHATREPFWQFLRECRFHFDCVVLVPGQLEYANLTQQEQTIEQIDRLLHNRARELGNVYVLTRGVLERRGLRVLGCTLWSAAGQTLGVHPEFGMLYQEDGLGSAAPMTPRSRGRLLMEHTRWLLETAQQGKRSDVVTVVLTCHCPSLVLGKIGKVPQEQMGMAASPVLGPEWQGLVDGWVCGRFAGDIALHGVRCVGNSHEGVHFRTGGEFVVKKKK